MDRDRVQIDTATATDLVQRLMVPGLAVTGVRRLHGGMVNRVCELVTDGSPSSIVAKLNANPSAAPFHHERRVLEWFRANTDLPVPEPYAVIERVPGFAGSGLLMQKIDGPNLSDARMSPRGVRSFQIQLAHHIAALHSHQRPGYGSVLDGEGYPRWVDVFAPMMEREFLGVRDQLSTQTRELIGSMIASIGDWLDEPPRACLVHGDLWATNILVDDRRPDSPKVLAFIDGTATFADPEYELAYLRLFRTATDDFFNTYSKRHHQRSGYERRCRVYWINTMLQHVRLFGAKYLPACDDLAQQVRKLS